MNKIKYIILLFILNTPLSIFAQNPELIIPVGHKEITGIYDIDVSPDHKLVVTIANKIAKMDKATGTKENSRSIWVSKATPSAVIKFENGTKPTPAAQMARIINGILINMGPSPCVLCKVEGLHQKIE